MAYATTLCDSGVDELIEIVVSGIGEAAVLALFAALAA
jgi:hypothetical protein